MQMTASQRLAPRKSIRVYSWFKTQNTPGIPPLPWDSIANRIYDHSLNRSGNGQSAHAEWSSKQKSS